LSGLSVNDYLYVCAQTVAKTQTWQGWAFRSDTTDFYYSNSVASGTRRFGCWFIVQSLDQANTKVDVYDNEVADLAGAPYGGTVTTAWTSNWTFKMRSTGVVSGGTLYYSYRVWLIKDTAQVYLPTDSAGDLHNNGSGTLTWDNTAYVPTSTTVNGHALSSNVTVTTGDIGAVPTTLTVAGHALSANVTLSPQDVGLPANALGYLHNDGSGTYAYSTPSGGGSSLPAAALGWLHNDGSDNLSWTDPNAPVATTCASTNSATTWQPCEPLGYLDLLAITGWILCFGLFLVVGFWPTKR
jgi:hypothetical protein